MNGFHVFLQINVREYRSGNKKRTIQRNWLHRVEKTKNNKTKTQYNMCRWKIIETGKIYIFNTDVYDH
jgi:hypothetical protein